MNGPALITEGREEQKELKEELKTTLAELTYPKLAEQDAAIVENVSKTLEEMPLLIYQG